MKGACPEFTKEVIKFDIDSDILGQSVQSYELKVIAPKADDGSPVVSYFFDFEKNWREKLEREQLSLNDTKVIVPTLTVKSISRQGEVEIAFSEPFIF